MTNTRRGRRLAVLAAALLYGDAVLGASSGNAADDAPRFSAEVTVTRTVVTEAGTLVREVPASRYRVERLAGGRLRLTMRATRPSPAIGPLADPYAGIVVEQDAQGAVNLLRPDGTPLPGVPPSAAGLVPMHAVAGDGWIARLADAPRRRQALAQALGARVGGLRGLDRYLVRDGDAVREVLVSPRLALPIEVNVMADRTLEERHLFEYEERGDGHVVRTRTRSESRLPDGSRQRLVSITILSEVEIGGAR